MSNDQSPISNDQWKIFVRKFFLLPVYFYRAFISPLTPPACRFTPTWSKPCSNTVSSKEAGSASNGYAAAIHGAAPDMTRYLKSNLKFGTICELISSHVARNCWNLHSTILSFSARRTRAFVRFTYITYATGRLTSTAK